MVTRNQVIREALATYEFFRRVGFESKDIRLLVQEDGCFVIVNAQDKVYFLKCGEVEGRFHEDLAEAIEAVGNGGVSDDELHSICNESTIFKLGPAVLASMMRKGFTLPKFDKNRGDKN